MLHFMGGLTFDSINYKLYDTPSFAYYPEMAYDYAQEYLIQYNLIISILQSKYPNYNFLKPTVVNMALT